MNVHVATPDPECEAFRALRAEGIKATEHELRGDQDYGRLFYRLWQAGEPFVLIEWDVVPWPGAVEKLLACPKPWCVHEYHLQPYHLAHSFGAAKYAPVGPPDEVWNEVVWWQLDGYAIPTVIERLGKPPCMHRPAFPHCRRLDRDPDLRGPAAGCRPA